MNLTCPILFSSVQKKKGGTKQVEKSTFSNLRRTNRIQAGVEMTVFKRGVSQVHVNCQHEVTLRQNVSIWPVSTWLMIGVSSTQKKQDPASKDAQTARGSSLQPSWFFFPFKTIYLFPFWENYTLSEDTCPDCQRRAKKNCLTRC